MTMTKEMTGILNTMAHMDFERAKTMLDGISMVLGTEYSWLNKRVVFKDEHGFHDAWAYAE